MKGTPYNTVILHWEECQTAWAELPWRDWVRFRGFGEGGASLLAGAEAGEHYFLVCVLGDAGELANVIPHRYVLSTDGRLVHGFDGLGASEREEYYRIQTLPLPTIEDSERCNELSSCGFAVNLPPLHTVQPLVRALPGLAGAQHGAGCWERAREPIEPEVALYVIRCGVPGATRDRQPKGSSYERCSNCGGFRC